jgi:2-polyprenyl-3-methyl-5-hydroxy-6-metoxy-1,4-benzoquinol methylase
VTSTVPAPSLESDDVRVCYLCGSDGETLSSGLRDRWLGAPGIWSLLLCRRCKLGWLNPRPQSDEIRKLYGERYYTHSIRPTARVDDTGIMRRIVKQALLSEAPEAAPQPARSCVERLAARGLRALGPIREVGAGSVMWLAASPRERLLDVGCGDGSFLVRMRELGWDVEGVEPDPVAAHAATRDHHLQITCAPVEDAALPAESFDVITMSHVIEHVHDPIKVLSECRRLLRPRGRLILVTPNIRSLGRFLFRSRWLGWDIPRHLFVFSSQSLRACVGRAGLEVQGVRTTARSTFHMLPSIRLLTDVQESARNRGRWRSQALLFWFLEHFLTGAIPCGEEILLMARRSR